MVAGTLAFALGALFCLQLRTLPDPVFIGFLPLLLVMSRDQCWRVMSLFLVGIFWTQLIAVVALGVRIPPALEGANIIVTGTIRGIPRPGVERQSFEFALDSAMPDWRPLFSPQCRLRLTWYQDSELLQAGMRWRFQVRLKRPHGVHNHSGTDAELNALRQGVCASGYVRTRDFSAQRLDDSKLIGWTGFRQRLSQRIQHYLVGFSSQGIITALVTGSRAGISYEHRQVLQDTGTAHLVAISGLHIGLLAGLGYLLGGYTKRLIPGLYPLFKPGRIEAACALLLASGYALLAGLTIPTQRALIMLVVLLLAGWLGRRPAASHAWCCALILVLIHDPLAASDAGLWLSFCAVAGLMYGLAQRRCRTNRSSLRGVRKLARMQWVAWVTLLPVSLFWFGGISLSSPLANFFAVPITGLVVVPLALLGVLLDLLGLGSVAIIALQLSATSMDLLLEGLNFVSEHAALYRLAMPDPFVVVVFGMGAVCILLLPSSFQLRWLGCLWLAPLLLPTPVTPGHGGLWINVFDVGQGLAVMVRTRSHALVYDTGPGREPHWNAGARIIAPNLFRLGVHSLDYLILSHQHLDHTGGAGGLMTHLPVKHVMTNIEPRKVSAHRFKDQTWLDCHSGARWEWDGYQFRILSPTPDQLDQWSVNNSSCVLHISGPGGTILFSGDIERQAENMLVTSFLKQQQEQLQDHSTLESTVLLSPHHGSKTSSSKAFLDAVNPAWVVISRGYRNRFRFPHPQVLDRYRVKNSKILDTACDGSIVLHFKPDSPGPWVSRWSERHARFWHVLNDGRCVWNGL